MAGTGRPISSTEVEQAVTEIMRHGKSYWEKTIVRAPGAPWPTYIAPTEDEVREHVATCNRLQVRYAVNVRPVQFWGRDEAYIQRMALSMARKKAGRKGKAALVAMYGADVADEIIRDAKAGR